MEAANQSPMIFDGHNDVLLRLWMKNQPDVQRDFLLGDNLGHLDFPRMHTGGFGGGFFAIFVPPGSSRPPRSLPDTSASASKSSARGGSVFAGMSSGGAYDMPLPPELPVGDALQIVLDQAAILSRIERQSDGRIKICRTAQELAQCFEKKVLGVVMHVEGAEAIDNDFQNLELLHRAGLRSLGPVWSRPTRFGHGVPFRYPGTPDTGPGLTPLGKQLVRELNRYKMVIDLSHLNEQGFNDVQSLSDAPLVATHSNAWQLCESSRNLTDRQLAAIRESDGMVGLNFATAFLRQDGRMTAQTPLDSMLSHLDYLIEKLGESRVGFGSDFDGAVVPEAIGDVAGLGNLRSAMREHGYNEELLNKLCHENWLALLERTQR